MAGELEGLHPGNGLQSGLVKQPTLVPTRKVGAGALGGAIVVVAAWTLKMFNIDVPAEVAASAAMMVQFALSYFVKDRVM